MSPSINDDLMFEQQKCLLKDDECTSASADRVFQVTPPIYGVSDLVSRMRLYVMQLLESPIGKITEKMNEIRFVISAIRYDLREGMDVLTTKITDSGVSIVNISDKLMMIITIACCLIIDGDVLLNIFPYVDHMQGLSARSQKLIELLPVDENEKEIQMMPSMRTCISYKKSYVHNYRYKDTQLCVRTGNELKIGFNQFKSSTPDNVIGYGILQLKAPAVPLNAATGISINIPQYLFPATIDSNGDTLTELFIHKSDNGFAEITAYSLAQIDVSHTPAAIVRAQSNQQSAFPVKFVLGNAAAFYSASVPVIAVKAA
ncbi:MAG: hypothetical protein EZS28_000544 [Streblomastix strix]|uniref:Uncharacterized protein n=1 Tax=Streblomastix strix TaxID=222440 RepID=A0A5J4X9F5_9EUKA|nr:MAG: hypothetical protein EZS28_000544 [Streblomastix strix]